MTSVRYLFFILLFLPLGLVAQDDVEATDTLSVGDVVQDSLEILAADSIEVLEKDSVILDIVAGDTSSPKKPEDSAIVSANKIVDTFPRFEESDIQGKLGALQKTVTLTYNRRVRGFIDYLTVRNRKYIIVMERRKNLYFPLFEKILKENNIPDEIKYLSIVESGLNPFAVSWAGAAGLWQFMPATGRELGLTINEYIDERLDPYMSTVAACRYLNRLYRIFGDWELALASYNCGPGWIKKAQRRSGKKGFWAIYDFLPNETRGYVPQFVAFTYTMNHMQDHKMIADSIQFPMEYDTVRLNQFTNLQVFCDQLEICYDDFIFLNPAIRTNVIPDNLSYPIRIPKEKMLKFVLNKEQILACSDIEGEIIEVPTSRKIKKKDQQKGKEVKTVRYKNIHTVKRGESIGKIAVKYGIRTSDIKKWNRLKSSVIKIGQKLIVYKHKSSPRSNESTTVKNENTKSEIKTTVKSSTKSKSKTEVKKSNTSSSKSNSNSSKNKYYQVRSGDSIWSISRKYGVTVDQLKKWNKLQENKIKPGQKLRVG